MEPDSDISDDEPEQLQYKIILLGDGAVGKTSIALRFTEDTFGKQYKQTIGLDFFIKHLQLPRNVNVALQIWDIGGQTIGGKMIGNYIYGAHAVLLCYDITSLRSFQSLDDWLQLVIRTFGPQAMPYLALVGNKTDLSHLRTVRLERHQNFAARNGMHAFFMSAKTGDNVSATLHRIAAELAGVPVTKPELEMAGPGIRAEIVNHPQHEDGAAPEPPRETRKKKDKCLIQ
eukprot:gnl/Trimastix_PCT/1618.p1 GENE.gnl/Trimastix_PCT/1618~~gnl/Trimastix_PCT/1618.p1  ORF type:complete len:230 (+),score=71.06 gnl/Trimastix_PCT/1618:199-888(+)